MKNNNNHDIKKAVKTISKLRLIVLAISLIVFAILFLSGKIGNETVSGHTTVLESNYGMTHKERADAVLEYYNQYGEWPDDTDAYLEEYAATH